MPMPGWWRHLNKRFFNPRTLKSEHNWSLITHVGRRSGKTFTTLIDAIEVSGGFAVYLMYGRSTDWAKNVLASGTGFLEKTGSRFQISNPRIVRVEDIVADLTKDAERPPAILRVKELVRFDAQPA